MKWTKLGQVLNLRTMGSEWMRTHAQNPAALVMDDRIRVYFNTRPAKTGALVTSHPAYVDLDAADPTRIVAQSPKPVMGLGGRGCFDEHGCMVSSLLRVDGVIWMYYVGWTRQVSVPYNWAIGIAVSRDGGDTFERMFPGPVIGSCHNEPYLQNGPSVQRDGSGTWHVWYSTGRAWLSDGEKAESRYVITHAVSADGVNWQRTGEGVLSESFADETQTTPSVLRGGSRHHMWFSYRHSTQFRNASRGYRVGYAWSDDLAAWHRDDRLSGIGCSPAGWDSEMLCYPHVFRHGGRLYMLYCGNGFGQDGFGIAVMDADELEANALAEGSGNTIPGRGDNQI